MSGEEDFFGGDGVDSGAASGDVGRGESALFKENEPFNPTAVGAVGGGERSSFDFKAVAQVFRKTGIVSEAVQFGNSAGGERFGSLRITEEGGGDQKLFKRRRSLEWRRRRRSLLGLSRA